MKELEKAFAEIGEGVVGIARKAMRSKIRIISVVVLIIWLWFLLQYDTYQPLNNVIKGIH